VPFTSKDKIFLTIVALTWIFVVARLCPLRVQTQWDTSQRGVWVSAGRRDAPCAAAVWQPGRCAFVGAWFGKAAGDCPLAVAYWPAWGEVSFQVAPPVSKTFHSRTVWPPRRR
jgi:hypothetical protein